ncbi:MAG: MFS transporter [Lachnospiraceae bacterium]|nr:MFS transporter [Lachnospiraceae bacterium]
MENGLFKKDFILVVIGQIISLFGNAAIRFALPLYLLNQTGSSALYGTVTACAFIPAILLSPIGGIIADRINKRNIMVILDFLTAIVILSFSILMDKTGLVVLAAITMMVLYGIAGTYQPSVQASVPALVSHDNIMAANSVINTISSFSSLTGPVLGGILYSAYGLKPVLYVCTACFFVSAVMEIFIKIPYKKQVNEGNIFHIAREDLSKGILFIRKDQPVIGKVLVIICGVNLFLSAMIITGLPYLVTEVFELGALQANKMYGYAEGALAAGGLAGGIFAGIFANKLSVKKAGILLACCAISVFPIGISLILQFPGIISYIVTVICCFIIMVLSTVFTIQMLSFVQSETPQDLIGKVTAVILAGSMCSQPLGNALYGVFFEICKGYEFVVIFFAAFASLVVAVSSKNIFKSLYMA